MAAPGIITPYPDSLTITNIAALRTASINPKTTRIQVLGYYAANDGGGGDFFVDRSDTTTADNGGLVIVNGTLRIKRIVEASTISVLAYGVKSTQNGGTAADAVNNAALINKALQQNNTVIIPNNCTIFVPISRPHAGINGNSTALLLSYNAIYVPPSKTLAGLDRNSSIVIAAPTTLGNNNSSGCLVIADSNATIKSITFDGNKANVSGAVGTSWSHWLVRTICQSTNIRIEQVLVKNVAASSNDVEGFGISTYCSTNVLVTDCEAFGVMGTGLHLDGDYLLGKINKNSTAIRVKCYDNVWMGLSCYGAQNIQILDCEFYRNQQNGLNVEWADNIVADNITSYNNGIAGLGTYGQVSNLQLRNSRLYSNATSTTDATDSEIVFRAGSWFAPAAGQTNPPRGILYSAEIVNTKVIPSSGKFHLVVPPLTGVPTDGGVPAFYPIQSLPNQILIDCFGAESWIFPNSSSDLRQQGIKFKGVRTLPLKTMRALPNWTPSSAALTRATFTGTGNLNASAQILTATAQFAYVGSPILDSGKTYLVTIRYQSPGVNSWLLYLQRQSVGATKSVSSTFTNLASDINTWLETQLVVSVPSAVGANAGINDWILVLQCNDATLPKSLVVDYVTVEEIFTSSTESLGLAEVISGAGAIGLSGALTAPSSVIGGAGGNSDIFRVNGNFRLQQLATQNTSTRIQSTDGGNGTDALFFFDAFPSNGSSVSELRYFRITNTTGRAAVVFYTADGTSKINTLLAGNSGSYLNAWTGNTSIGAANITTNKLDINGSLKCNSAFRLGLPAITLTAPAGAATGATSISLTASQNFTLTSGTIVNFGSTQFNVSTSTALSSTATSVPISGYVGGAIAANATTTNYSLQIQGDRWGWKLNGTETGTNNVGSDLVLESYNNQGNNGGLGGAIVATALAVTRASGLVTIPLLATTTLQQPANGTLGFFGVTPIARQTGGVATAGATYGTNEQTMLQAVYNALRGYGLLT